MQETPLNETRTGFQPFAISAEAVDQTAHMKIAVVFLLAVLTVAAAGIFTINSSKASQAGELTHTATQGLLATKSDRAAGPDRANSCDSQAWGAWSEDCASALNGGRKVRNVSYTTVEKASPTVNETILARYPAAN
ncbi:hypothetical protein GCM10009077_27360 [Roseibium denhamense]